MKNVLITGLIALVMFSPLAAYGQRGGGGHGGGGGSRGGGGGGGFGGGRGGGAPSGGMASRAPSAPGYRAAGPAAHGPVGHAGAPNSFAYGHRPDYHGGWYHGDWHGNWGHPWGYRPYGWHWGGGWGWPAWGFGWGLGTGIGVGLSLGSPWGWGYYSYSNPYWVAPPVGVSYINYGQPLVVPPPTMPAPQNAPPPGYPGTAPAPAPAPVGQYGGAPPPAVGASPAGAPALTDKQEQALAIFDMARTLFRRGDYAMALTTVNRALAQAPNDTLMHEFRALCLFATNDYQQSAAAIYAVLSIGPGWDWATVSGLYGDANAYTQQLRALEAYCNDNPQAPHARFLLAYHYLLEGHNEEAATELEAVVELQPKDQLSAQLLKGLKTPPGDQPPAGPSLGGPTTTTPPAAPVETAMVVGDWKASRPDGSKFELVLTKDNQFNWKFTQQDKTQELKGTYTLANNYLILSATDQNALVGQVAMEPGDKLQFKLAGGAQGDPGLIFSR